MRLFDIGLETMLKTILRFGESPGPRTIPNDSALQRQHFSVANKSSASLTFIRDAFIQTQDCFRLTFTPQSLLNPILLFIRVNELY
jgi:hypothetical protein